MSMKKGKGGAMTVDSIIDKLLSVRGKRPGHRGEFGGAGNIFLV